MDQKRLFLAIAISVAILLIFQVLIGPHLAPPPHPAPQPQQQTASQNPTTPPAQSPPGAAPSSTAQAVPKEVPRVRIAAHRVSGSISLLGARLDDLVLTDYRETLAPDSPKVRLLEPRSEEHPYYVQYGWSAAPGGQVKLPDTDTMWAASSDTLSPGHPVTLSWDNGAGLIFQIGFAIDDEYMFTVQQSVRNTTATPVKLFPWSRVRRDYTPATSGFNSLYGSTTEGLLGVTGDTLHGMTYSGVKSKGEKSASIAYEATSDRGWAGISDKYWLAALVPNQETASKLEFRYFNEGGDRYQVNYLSQTPQIIGPNSDAMVVSHVFTGPKIISLLDSYGTQYHIPSFNKAVDFGWLYLLAQPIFYCLDWLNSLLGNFGLAILVFTVLVKALFFPLANYSYRSMSKMKLLAPKMQALRERFKEEPQRMQQEMMQLYRTEKVNPASGCLPMLVQIPVFMSLYVVIYTTIEMRQAPFFGWIHDLSAVDPTNVFNLFGLLPFDPTQLMPLLHLGAWPLIMGLTMFLQQKLNPPPPDPVQARMFQFMPVIFTFMLANFPAGLVIYWTWNNLLSIAQQWLIMRRTHLARPGLART